MTQPEVDPVTPEPTATDPQPPAETVESLMEKLAAASAEAEKWKGFSRTNEDRAKANAEAARKLKEIEDRELPELERYKRSVQELTQRAEQAERTALRAQVASDKGIPANLVAQLTGGTLDELNAAADALLAWRGQQAPAPVPQPRPDPSQGAQPGAIDSDEALWQQYQPHVLNNIRR